MKNHEPMYSYERLHLEELREEAAQERLANELPRKPGLLEAALTLLFTGRQSE